MLKEASFRFDVDEQSQMPPKARESELMDVAMDTTVDESEFLEIPSSNKLVSEAEKTLGASVQNKGQYKHVHLFNILLIPII